MATIKEARNKRGELTGYKFSVAVEYIKIELSPDPNQPEKKRYKYSQVWRTTTIPRPAGLTPAKEKKEVERLADEWEKEQRIQYDLEKQGRARLDKDTMTLDKFITDHWMAKHVKNGIHTPSTISFFTYMGNDIKAYFNDKHPGLKLAQINREDVLDYLYWMKNEAKTKQGKPYGATTIQHHFSTLRNILEYATYTDYLTEDPCTKLKPEDRPRRESKEIDFLDEDEAIRFLSALDSDKEKAYWNNATDHLYWKALVNVLITTGLRRGELVGLQWGDFDKKNLMLHIRRNVTIDASHKGDTDPEKKIHIGQTKGKTIRKVPISQYVANLLIDLKKAQDEQYKTLLPSAYIFCRTDAPYQPMYPTEPTRLTKKFIKRHDLKDVSPHDLRHSAATLAIQSGASVKEIQALLGHKDAATTLKFYAGITEKAQRGTVEGIENIIRPKAKTTEKAE